MRSPRMIGFFQLRITSQLAIEPLETRRLLAADLVALSPADGAISVASDSNLTLTFSDDVRPGPGAGRILIKNAADGSVVETAGGVGSLDHANEHLTLSIPNPAGGSLLVRFGLVNATNDWWWAIDNLEITGLAQGGLYKGIADRTTWNFITLPEPLAADFNGDGKVDLADFGILKQNFAMGDTKAEGDANGDAQVDLTDFGILKVLISSAPPPAAPVPHEAQLAAAMHLAFAEMGKRTASESAEADPAFGWEHEDLS